MKAHHFAVLVLIGCGGGGGGTAADSGSSDGPMVFMDAPPSVPAMITISGVAAEQAQSGSTPQAGVTIAVFRSSDENTPLAMATTDAQGKYSIKVATNNQAIEGFLKATKSGYVDTFAYPSSPWIADDTSADANMLTTGTFNLLVQFGGGHAGNGVVTLQLLDTAASPVMGATVASSPASGVYKYSDASGFPTSTTATAADGLAFMFDVPPGKVTLSATKTGMTFHAHQVNARADKFTTSVIAP